MTIPRSHPRYRSLKTREALVEAHRDGRLSLEGLIAHGRGEAFNYLLGEETAAPALVAEKAAAAYLLTAKRPVLSVNGNTAVLAAKEIAALAKAIPARVEVNLFHRTEKRVALLVRHLRQSGVVAPLGLRPDARIPGLESARSKCSRSGIFTADVVLVPLEDGDRAAALVKMGKKVLAIDLNPLSRTSRTSTVAVTDEVVRALVNIERFVRQLRGRDRELARVLKAYDRSRNLVAVHRFLVWRLGQLRE